MDITVSHGDTAVTIEADEHYSPDLLDDMCRRASVTLVATVVQLITETSTA